MSLCCVDGDLVSAVDEPEEIGASSSTLPRMSPWDARASIVDTISREMNLVAEILALYAHSNGGRHCFRPLL